MSEKPNKYILLSGAGAAPKRSSNSLIYFDNLNVIFPHTPGATPLRSFTLSSMPFGRTFGVPTPDFFR